MNILPLTLLDSIVVIGNTSDQRVPNRRALQSITMASCRSPYIMQRIECPLKWYLRVCTPAVLYAVVRPRLWGFAVWRGNPLFPPPLPPPCCGGGGGGGRRVVGARQLARRCMPETPVERHVCVQDSPVRAPRQIGSVKFNVIHFIEPTIHRPYTASREMFYTCAKPYPAYVSWPSYIVTVNTWPMPLINLSASLFRGYRQIMRPDYGLFNNRTFV